MDHSIARPTNRTTTASGTHRPVVTAATVGIVGYVVMTAILLGLGYLLTHFLIQGSIGSWDDSVNRWFVTQRTSTLNSVTAVGSMLGSTLPVVGIALIAAVVSAIGRRWGAVALLAVALVIEVTTFLTTAVVINRPRPSVPKLDVAPPTSSFPSGHTAAAIVLYVGLAIIVSGLTRSMFLRAVVWFLAVALPVFVALSRLYRGMHHPTDVFGSCVLGAGALLFGLMAARRIAEAGGREETRRTQAQDQRGSQTPGSVTVSR
jgi:membrane-associated phospholipid phosphatase